MKGPLERRFRASFRWIFSLYFIFLAGIFVLIRAQAGEFLLSWAILFGLLLFLPLRALRKLLRRDILDSLRRLTQATQLVAAGDSKTEFPSPSSEEMALLARSIQDLIQGMKTAEEKIRRAGGNGKGAQDEGVNERLTSLNEEMEDLLRVVSHDLKSPLINIQGFTTRLEQRFSSIKKGFAEPDFETKLKEMEPSVAESFSFIHKAVEKMDTMIQSLLRLSRVGRRADPLEGNDLNQILVDVRALFSHQLMQKGIELVIRPLPSVRCRKNEIHQVFCNLISNAINYMRDKSPKKIEVGYSPFPDYFQFYVKDTGVGIAEKDLPKVFRIFTRLGKIPAPGGEGVGTTIVRKIIHGHGGHIWVESKEGEGSTFFFTLPTGVQDGESQPGGHP